MSRPRLRTVAKGLAWAGLGGVLLLAILSLANAARLDHHRLRQGMAAWLERTEEIRERAATFDPEAVLAALPPGRWTGAVYRFDDRVLEAAPDRFSAPEEAAAPDLHRFEFSDPERPGLRPDHSRADWSLADGHLHLQYQTGDVWTNPHPLDLDPADIGEAVIRLRAERGTRLVLSWAGDQEIGQWHYSMVVDVIPDGEFHTYVVNAREVLQRDFPPGERVARLFLHPSNAAGDRLAIDFLHLRSRTARYRSRPYGASVETLGGDRRRVLYMQPPGALAYRVTVPDRDPVLTLGLGTLQPGRPAAFTVRVSQDDAARALLHQAVLEAGRWEDHRLDLSPWAGQAVTITLEVTGAADTVAFWSHPTLSGRPPERLNVVLYLEDTLRADHLSAYGHPHPTTPVKDRLAEEGVLFVNAVAPATNTRSSVTSLMTSLLPSATGVVRFFDVLSERHLTLAEALRHQGFATAAFIQNANAGPDAGLDQGFDRTVGADLFGDTTAGLLGERLDAWLRAHADRNFFLYLHVLDPHGPYAPAAPFPGTAPEPGPGETPLSWNRLFDPEAVPAPTVEGRRRRYAGEIRHNDQLFAGFLDRLAALGLREETLVIFLSDHGEYQGEAGHWGHHPPGLRPVTRVPLLMVHPGRLPRGRRIEETVQLLDVMPTVLDLAEIDRDAFLLQGDSLLGLIAGQAPESWSHRLCLSEEPFARIGVHDDADRISGCGSLFYHRWHLINSERFNRRDGLPQPVYWRVYDFLAEGREPGPLSRFRPDPYLKYRCHTFLRTLQRRNREIRRWLSAGSRDVIRSDPEVRRRLRDLGYIQ